MSIGFTNFWAICTVEVKILTNNPLVADSSLFEKKNNNIWNIWSRHQASDIFDTTDRWSYFFVHFTVNSMLKFNTIK